MKSMSFNYLKKKVQDKTKQSKMSAFLAINCSIEQKKNFLRAPHFPEKVNLIVRVDHSVRSFNFVP